ncbi:MAG: hypothetical protein PF692_11935 [Kiritimatiellae bacterium]|nr:hypothetical protein [Kiritimatiellia bacterium]
MIVTSTSYWTFGLPLETGEQPQAYRFGFNGMPVLSGVEGEKDPEITGQEGSHYTAAFWEYDTRIARRWNVDPAYRKYPFQSNYSTFNGNPILYADPSGLWGENKAHRKRRKAIKRIDRKNINREVSDVKYDEETGEYGFSIRPGGHNYVSSEKSEGASVDGTPIVGAYEGEFVYENKSLNAWIPSVKFAETKVGKGLEKADEFVLNETDKDIANGTYHTPNVACRTVAELTFLVKAVNVGRNWFIGENIYREKVSRGEAIKNTLFLPVDIIPFVNGEVANKGIQFMLGAIGTNLTFPSTDKNEDDEKENDLESNGKNDDD